MNIFLAPRSNETSHEHFLSTIENGIDYSVVKPYLNNVGKKTLANTGKLFAWGNKESKKTSWAKMKSGNYVLFYKNKRFIHYGKVLHTQLSEDLALKLWPAKKNQKPWTCIFFLDHIEAIDLPLSVINKISGGRYKMDRVQGFMPLNENVVQTIKKEFGSIENFLSKYLRQTEINPFHRDQVKTNTTSIKRDATTFEKQIKEFLEKMQFNDVDGARDSFRINGIQIDVCGGWENTLLVIECKSRQQLGTSLLRSAIGELRGKIEILKRGFSEHPIYKKYDHFQFILATKNIDVRKVDIDYAIQQPRIYVWSNDFFEYYSNLYSFIKPYAKFDLLGEMHVLPLHSEPIRVSALRSIQKGRYVYNFLIDPRELLEISFVARRNIPGERYYQRIIDEKRLKKIGDYIKRGGIFPNNIVIAFRSDLKTRFHIQDKLREDLEFGVLEFPKDYRSCWIIDGQHRLYSFANLDSYYFSISVTAFENLQMDEQRKYFLDINRNQKPIESDLLWDLSGDVISEKDGIIANIAKSLNISYSSPLQWWIYYPSAGLIAKKDKIKLSAICMAIKKNKIADELLSQNTRNPLFTNDPESQVKKTSNSLIIFLSTCKKLFGNNWELRKNGFVLTNGGIAVLLGLFEKIVTRSSQLKASTLDESFFEKYLKPLRKRFENADTTQLKKMRLNTTSEGGKSDLLSELILEIRTGTGDTNFGGELKSKQIIEDFRKLEEQLKKLIYSKCYSSDDENWFEKISDPYTHDIVSKRAKNLARDNPDELYKQLTLGECLSIVRKNSDIFLPIFTDEVSESSFTSAKIFESALTNINEMRNRIVHSTGARNKMDDEIIVQSQLQRILDCIADELAEEMRI